MTSEAELLRRLRCFQPDRISLGLERLRSLLTRLGNPQFHLPTVVHVAGTNGKGSTIAFLRAMLEAAGYLVHVYTSPHLVHYRERIRVAGRLIDERSLWHWLEHCERVNDSVSITYFELTTAIALLAFANEPADFTLLETGLGGRLDATNVITNPAVTVITRISFDHMTFLGDTLPAIAAEKAGIMKKNVPVILSPQTQQESARTLIEHARAVGAPIYEDWCYQNHPDGLEFTSAYRTLRGLRPSLCGEHQQINAATALAALDILDGGSTALEHIQQGLSTAQWPGRLQQLTAGPLFEQLPPDWELWLDGGHNDSAGEVLACQARNWQRQKPNLALIGCVGMLGSKQPLDFLAPLAAELTLLYCVPIEGERVSFAPDQLAQLARQSGINQVKAMTSLAEVGRDLPRQPNQPARLLICGSLALVGQVLRDHQG